MDKLNKFSNQMEGSDSSSDYSKEETKRKGKQKKQKSKNKKEKKKLRKKTAAKPEILGGFDCKCIGDRMMNEWQLLDKDEMEENR
jgi:hypothetical protein